MLKNPVFLRCKVKTPCEYFFGFSQFHEHIFRSSCSQLFFKLDALKNLGIS